MFLTSVGSLGHDEFAEMHLHPNPVYSIPSDNVYMSCMAGTQSGRIFLGGKDGCVYEVAYQVSKLYCLGVMLGIQVCNGRCGGLMISALDSGSGSLVLSTGRGSGLCSWARHFTLVVPLSTQVYKWVPANLLLGVTLQWTSFLSREE